MFFGLATGKCIFNPDRPNATQTHTTQTDKTWTGIKPRQDTTRTGRNLDRTQPGQTQPGQGHNRTGTRPGQDTTWTETQPGQDTTQTGTQPGHGHTVYLTWTLRK